MQNDLISRSALIAYVKEIPTWEATNRGFFTKRYPSGFFAPNDIVSAIRHAPAVDAVEVVRCKDCKYFQRSWCYAHNMIVYPRSNMRVPPMHMTSFDDFCSYGERRVDDGK